MSKTHIPRGSQKTITTVSPRMSSPTSISSTNGSSLVPRIRPLLPPVGGASPVASTQCILGLLVTSAGVYAPPHISAQSLFSKFHQLPTRPPLLEWHIWPTVNGSLQKLHARGGLWRGRSRQHHKVYLDYYLDGSAPYWELDRTVSLPPPSQTHYSFYLTFFPTFDFRALVSPSFLPIPIS